MAATNQTPTLAQRVNGSRSLLERSHRLIPGGAHTYAKSDDQYPEAFPLFIARGKGCRVWDVDGNEFIEYGMGLRSVTLGHGFEPVVEGFEAAARNHLREDPDRVIDAFIDPLRTRTPSGARMDVNAVLPVVEQLLAMVGRPDADDEAHRGVLHAPLLAQYRDEVFVGRIRRDESVEHGLNMWVVADNLRRGAATNGVLILEHLMKTGRFSS